MKDRFDDDFNGVNYRKNMFHVKVDGRKLMNLPGYKIIIFVVGNRKQIL